MKSREIPANIGEYLKYDDTSPTCLRWIKKTHKSVSIEIGDIAGTKNLHDYFYTKFNGKLYQNHRIIFCLHHGYCPDYIDHIDNNPSNNKIENLRECSFSENQWNKKIHKNNKCGHKGVSKHSSGNYWFVQVNKNNITYSKYFPLDKFKEACSYADELRKQLHGEFANTGEHPC